LDVISAAKNNYPGTGAFPGQQNLTPRFKTLARRSLGGEGNKPFSIWGGGEGQVFPAQELKAACLKYWQTNCPDTKQTAVTQSALPFYPGHSLGCEVAD